MNDSMGQFLTHTVVTVTTEGQGQTKPKGGKKSLFSWMCVCVYVFHTCFIVPVSVAHHV